MCGTYYYYNYWPPGPGNIGDFEVLERFGDEENKYVKPIIEAKNIDTLINNLVQAIITPAWKESDIVHGSFKNKVEFAFEVATMKFPNIVASLKKLLSHENELVRNYTSRLISEIAKKEDISESVPQIVKSLSDKSSTVKYNTAKALTDQYINEKNWVKIQELLKSKDDEVRKGTTLALKYAAYKIDISTLIQDFAKLLSDNNQDVRAYTADALENAASNNLDISKAVPALAKALSDKNYSVKDNALDALATTAWKLKKDISVAISGLTKLLSDEEYNIKEKAAKCLGYASFQGADISKSVNSLIKLLSSDLDSYTTLNVAVIWSLKEFASKKKQNAKLVFDGIKKLKCDNPEVKKLIEKCEEILK